MGNSGKSGKSVKSGNSGKNSYFFSFSKNLGASLPKTGSCRLLFAQHRSLNFAGKHPLWGPSITRSILFLAPTTRSHFWTISLNVDEAVLCFLRNISPSWGLHSFLHRLRSAVSGIPSKSSRVDIFFSSKDLEIISGSWYFELPRKLIKTTTKRAKTARMWFFLKSKNFEWVFLC